MPKTTATGSAKKSELPSTIARSSKKAQRTFAKAHDSALGEYHDEKRAHRVAYSALKHSYEKVGDHWEAKTSAGPSDQRARSGGPNPSGETAEGVNAEATKDHLYEVARRLEIPGRSKMTKSELVSAIERANRRRTASSRS
ncbi:ChaB family protein [Gordonia sp. CPCC 205333]|uniref:ChaB family protein n=1 Tax=Gordonia sp. CPCC 205333 TaxID=3140790 RepID=UPI003AF3FFC6